MTRNTDIARRARSTRLSRMSDKSYCSAGRLSDPPENPPAQTTHSAYQM